MNENTDQKISENPLVIKMAKADLIVALLAVCICIFVVVGFEYDRGAATQEELLSATSGNSCVKGKIKNRLEYELNYSASAKPISRYTLKLFISGCENESLVMKQADAIRSINK